MARYRSKDEIDLTWNRIRRRLTRELDTQIADVREEMLNRLLTEAFDEYQKAISTGERLELDSKLEASFVRQVIEGSVHVAIERDEAA
jgi:hypothetical protein